jgi:uncharacterized membrane protein YeiB
MFNVFDQPWTLLAVAVIALLVVLMLRRTSPDKWRWWLLLVPIFLALLAFALDKFVETDTEKITKVIDTGIKAVEEENLKAIDAIIAANYHDSYHNTKKDLMYYCESLLSQPFVEKNKKTSLEIEKSAAEATAFLTVLTHFDKESYIYQNYKPFMLIKVKLNLQKQADKSWLINRAEILEIDRQSVKWRQIG